MGAGPRASHASLAELLVDDRLAVLQSEGAVVAGVAAVAAGNALLGVPYRGLGVDGPMQLSLGGSGIASHGDVLHRASETRVSVAGDVDKPGVYEMVLGSSLRELVDEVAAARQPQIIQIGGATGRIIPYDMVDTPLAFESMLGAGAITVFSEKRDVIDVVHRTMEFRFP